MKKVELIQRQIDAIPRGIFAQVSKNVGQLKGQTTIDGAVARQGIVGLPDANASQSDRRCHSVTVLVDRCPIGHSHSPRIFGQIAGDANDEIAQQLDRNAITLDRMAQSWPELIEPPEEIVARTAPVGRR